MPIIKILFQKKLVSVMHAALPYLCPSNYPTLATPLFVTKCFVHMRTSEENGIANEGIVLE